MELEKSICLTSAYPRLPIVYNLLGILFIHEISRLHNILLPKRLGRRLDFADFPSLLAKT